MKRGDAWNRCDDCGRFIPMRDFDAGAATRRLTSEDTAFSSEEYETLCRNHALRDARKLESYAELIQVMTEEVRCRKRT